MNEIKTLWVARDRNGSLNLFTEEPFSTEGEWFSNGDSFKIDNNLLHGDVSYEDGPKELFLLIK